jgi:hypothetical protein
LRREQRLQLGRSKFFLFADCFYQHADAITRDEGTPADLPDALIFRIRVKLLHQKYFAFSEAQISRMFRPVPHPSEGRIAIVTDVGCDGRFGLRRRARAGADGKAVWS